MRLAGLTRAVAQFNTPRLGEPAEVGEARAAYEGVSDLLRRTGPEIVGAREAVEVAKRDDRQAAAEAYARGETPKAMGIRTARAVKHLDDLEQRIRALDKAVDETGNTLAAAIADRRTLWLTRLHKAKEDAAAAFEESVAAALAAASQLDDATGSIAWLERFDAADATVGGQVQYSGRDCLMVPRPGPGPGLEDELRVVDLLKLAGSVGTAPPSADPAGPPPLTGQAETTSGQRVEVAT